MTAVVAVGASGCGGGSDDSAATTSTAKTSTTTRVTTTKAAAGGANGQNGGGQTGGGNTGTRPTITSFQAPDNIDCHNGDLQMFTASWTTTDATRVTMSIDGPGVHRTYEGPNGSDSFLFNCSSSDTFLLTAYGSGGQTATRTITLQPRNVQSPTTQSPTTSPTSPAPTNPSGPTSTT